MKKEVILFITAILAMIATHAQTGNTGFGTTSVIVNLLPGDQITESISMCGCCSAPNVSSTYHRLEIVRL